MLMYWIKEKQRRVLAWESKSAKRPTITYVCLYSIAFLLVAFAVLFVYPSNGRSILWSVDGIEQYFPFFLYFHDWIYSAISNFLSGQPHIFEMWSYDLGYGSDVLSVMDTFYDPLNFFGALFPSFLLEYVFQFLVVFRLYLAGLAFSFFAFKFKMGRFRVLFAALLYSLCATAMVITLWPAGAWPMILFPLVLIGIERTLSGKSPIALIASLFLTFVISYYFAFGICLFMIAYLALRVTQTGAARNVTSFLKQVLKYAGFTVLAMCMAAAVLLPSVMGLFSIERFTDARVGIDAFYSLPYYVKLFSGFLSGTMIGSDCFVGFGAIGLIAVILMFLQKGQHKVLKIAFVIMTLFLMLPLAGSIFNGFNYATNRWVWAYALLVCFIVARMLPSIINFEKPYTKALLISILVYIAIVFLVPSMRSEATIAAIVVLAFAVMIIISTQIARKNKALLLSVCMVFSLIINTFYMVSPAENGVGALATPLFAMRDKLTTDSPNTLAAQMLKSDDTLWRYDGDQLATARTRNDSLVQGLMGSDFYNSTYSGDIDKFRTDLGLVETGINFSYTNNGSRAILNALLGTKYLVVPSFKNQSLNYNYSKEENIVASGSFPSGEYNLIKGEHYLPLAFTYDEYVPQNKWEEASPIQRQEMLLQGPVLDSDAQSETASEPANLQLENTVVNHKPGQQQGLIVEDGQIKVLQKGAVLELTYEGVPNSETYAYFENMHYQGLSPLDALSKEEYEALSWYHKLYKQLQDFEYVEPTAYAFKIASDTHPADVTQMNFNEKYHMYGQKEDYLFNLGYSDAPSTRMTIRFSDPGIYTFDKLQVQCQPMQNVNTKLAKLAETNVDDLQFSTNEISASVDSDKPTSMFLSVAYADGWSAKVNGQPVKIDKANLGFMSIALGEGHSDIVLTYKTPGIDLGLQVSAIGLVIFAVLSLFYCRRKRSTMNNEKLL